jgi:hypothetical protein
MLNSSYGKTCEGLHEQTYELKSENKYKDYIYYNYNTVDSVEVIGSKYFIKQNVEVNDSAAYTYIGAFILSMSKRIMNEVMCLAEDNGIEIYY